jgi:hypothetical protein
VPRLHRGELAMIRDLLQWLLAALTAFALWLVFVMAGVM